MKTNADLRTNAPCDLQPVHVKDLHASVCARVDNNRMIKTKLEVSVLRKYDRA